MLNIRVGDYIRHFVPELKALKGKGMLFRW